MSQEFGSVRAIPACAGRTSAHVAGVRVCSGHPRVCGENHPGAVKDHEVVQAIPACAGRTCRFQPSPLGYCGPSPRVRGEHNRPAVKRGNVPGHPRVCGENLVGERGRWQADGPSPRVRGEHSTGRHDVARVRAIPACAGRTPRRQRSLPTGCRAIPACAGRTPEAGPARTPIAGPSPRVRGELDACLWSRDTGTGHPRVCGENSGQRAPCHRLRRAIPACAGRTIASQALLRISAGPSPRVRGELMGRKHAGTIKSGPSPRVRGERCDEARITVVMIGPSPRVRGELKLLTVPPLMLAGHPRVCGENLHFARPR